jgi:mannose-6-phosphate isomerase-like protein (cupin superfamily)
MNNDFHISVQEANDLLAGSPERFEEVMKKGSISVEFYKPEKIDQQQPHTKDELYIIISGSSVFLRDGEMISCQKSDVIFVPAKMEHRFINFSADFSTWVIFYGEEIR